MNTIDALPHHDWTIVADHPKTDEPAAARAPSKADIQAMAELRMRRGKRLVISGFVVAVIGIIAYCVVCLSAAVNPDLGSTLLKSPGWLAGPTLGTIGLGTLLWLVGSFIYLNGAMDSDANGSDIEF